MNIGYNDGAAGASGGAAQLPSLLAGYAARPGWKVAGVDYAVGVGAGAVLADPATLSGAGVSVDAVHHVVHVTGNNVTLNGYDFGRGGGYAVVVGSGVSGTVIENSRFQVGANQQVPIQAGAGSGNLTVQNCTLDGGGGGSGTVYALIAYNGSGTFTAQYNSFVNAPADAIDFSSGNLTYVVSHNLFENLGTSSGSHPDTIQEYGGNSTNSVFDFNTVYQPNAGGEQGIQLGAQGGSTIANTQIENNTVLAKGPAISMSYAIAVAQSAGSPINGAVVSDNYIDTSGAYGPFYPPSGSGLTFSGNVDIQTGAALAAPSGTSATDVGGVSASVSGTQVTGAAIALTLALDQAYFITGTPTLTLNDGDVASYASGSGTSQLVFTTTVSPADQSVATLAVTGVNLAGGAISDGNGNVANLSGAIASLPGVGTSVAPQAPVQAPTLVPAPVQAPALVPAPAIADPYADGAAQASAGAAQLPGLLAGDAITTAWKVAGVDYAVGTPSGTALRDPTAAANLPAGTSLDAANHLVHVHGNNVTLNGFDFGLHGGWGVSIDAGTTGTTTIENSTFTMGASEPIAINASSTNVGNLSVLHDTFNGTQQNIPSVAPPPAGTGLGAAINYNGSGSFVAEYNDLYGLPADGIDFSSGTVTPTIEYNLFDGIGYTPGAHPDPVQFYGDTVNNALIAFNTIYSPQGSNRTANEGLAIEAQGGSVITNTTIENNTIIATGPTRTQTISVGVFQDPGNTVNGVIVADNDLDPTAAYEPFGSGGSAPSGSNLIYAGNVNLLTGAVIASPAGTRSSDVVSVSANPSSGVETAGSVVLLTLAMDQAETVTGAPTLSLNDGGAATYVSGSGTNALTFSTTVGAGDQAVPALAITGVNLPGGASIRDAAGSAPDLSGAKASLPNLSISKAPTTHTVTVNLSEDAYLGNAQAVISLDGVQQGGAQTVTALHGPGQSQAVSYTVGAGGHDVKVAFINDAYGGSPSLDRNLYVDSVSYDGAAASGARASLYSAGASDFAVGPQAPAPTSPANDDTLVLNLSQDAYNGDAAFLVYVDGQVQGPAQAVSTLHSSGGSEAFTFAGAYGAGAHAVEVDFINDAYGGTASTDRNLYVNSLSYNGQAYAGDQAALYSNGGYKFAVNGADHTSNTGVSVGLHG